MFLESSSFQVMHRLTLDFLLIIVMLLPIINAVKIKGLMNRHVPMDFSMMRRTAEEDDMGLVKLELAMIHVLLETLTMLRTVRKITIFSYNWVV
jgi:hypothetical protein